MHRYAESLAFQSMAVLPPHVPYQSNYDEQEQSVAGSYPH